jgi:NAD(P)-dependent dehydrogenase (short-subunit alcohol dehydrogenase family)
VLTGEVAVVTGAGRGIGRAIALAHARAGALVVATGRSLDALRETATLIRSEGAQADVITADVRDPASLGALAAEVNARHGRVDALVANSGIGGPTAPAWEVEPDDWADTIATNLTGVFLTCRAFVPAMLAQRRGSIVVIGSVTGKRPMKGRTPYAASKLGLVGFVRSLAADVGETGIRANVISPGATDGPRLRWVFEEQARLSGRTVQAVEEDFVADTPLRRLVTAEEVADCAVFLASHAARAITGHDINVTGGWVMH